MSIEIFTIILTIFFGIPAIWVIYPITRAWIYALRGFKEKKYFVNMKYFWNIYFVAWTSNNLNWRWAYIADRPGRYWELVGW